MGLMEELQTVAAHLDSSLQPSSNEVGPLLGALIAYTEHGSAVVKAAEGENGAAAVSDLLSDDGHSKPATSSSSSGKDK